MLLVLLDREICEQIATTLFPIFPVEVFLPFLCPVRMYRHRRSRKGPLTSCESFAREVWESASGLDRNVGRADSRERRQVFQKVYRGAHPTYDETQSHNIHDEAPSYRPEKGVA